MRLILIVLMTIQPAMGAVLIQGPAVPDLEYRAALKADPDLISPSRQSAQGRPSAAQRELLLARFASAQKTFLENSKEEAAVQFQSVIELLSADDWSRSDRQMFLHSYLRLAQMELQLEKQNAWLTRALSTGDDVTAEAGLFPPPLLRTLQNLRREVPRAAIPKNIYSEGWNLVLLNGIACTKDNCAGFPIVGEKIRATFLSDMWQPVTMAVDAGSLKNIKPPKIAWVTGDCAKTQFSAASQPFKDSKAFWGLACGSAPAKAIDLRPVGHVSALPVMDIKEKSPAFYESRWFWGGVVVAAAAALIVNGQKRSEEREPTTSYGYQ